MPTVRQTRPKRFHYRKLPLWFQWGMPAAVAIGAIVALVIWVHYESNDVPSEASVNSPSAIAEQNREANVLEKQEQAPHTAKLASGVTPANGLRSAITIWLDHQIKIGAYNGPLTHASCRLTKGSTSARVAMYCPMVTADVTYPFYGIVVPATGSITYCQQVAPPVNGMKGFLLSKRCVAVQPKSLG